MEILAFILCNQDDFFASSYVLKKSRFLYPLIDVPLLFYVEDALKEASVNHIVHVVNKSSSTDLFKALENKKNILKEEIIKIKEQIKKYDIIILLDGDYPLIQGDTIRQMIDLHQKKHNDITYQEGIYLINKNVFLKWLNNDFDINNIEALFIKENYQVQQSEFSLLDCLKIKTLNDLNKANQIMKDRIIQRHLDKGVIILSSETTFISSRAIIGNDTIIHPNTFIYGKSIVGVGCELGPNAFIIDSFIDNFIKVGNCMIKEKTIKNN